MTQIHRHDLRVYYEDTDMAGIVYYANYLRYIERGRSDWVRDIGLDQNTMKDQDGLVFAVRRVEADYHAPARLDDCLTVETALTKITGATFVMDQTVRRETQTLFFARVTIAVMTLAGRPTRVPASIRALLPAQRPPTP